MNMDKALAVIDGVTLELQLEGFVDTMEHINENYDDVQPEVRVAFRTVKAGLARIFAAQEVA